MKNLCIVMFAFFVIAGTAFAQRLSDFEFRETVAGKEGAITRYSGTATDINIPAELGGYKITSIRVNTFARCALTSVVISQGITNIGNSAFAESSALASVTLPEGLTLLGHSAFARCENLQEITIPVGVTTVRQNTFTNCTKLASVSLPQGLTNIEASAFFGCRSLTSVTIPATVQRIDELAFGGCTALKTVTLSQSTQVHPRAFEGVQVNLVYR